MSLQTMNLLGIVSVTVTAQEEHKREDGSVYFTQDYRFFNESGHRFDLTTFSAVPGVLQHVNETGNESVCVEFVRE